MKKIKEKITTALGNETLSRANVEVKEGREVLQKKPKARKQPNLEAKKASQRYEIPREIVESPTKKKSSVLSILNIAPKTKIDDVVVPGDIRSVEFSVTTPTGFDADEVEQFCNILEKSIRKYVTAIELRDEDVMKLAGEVDRLEEKLMVSQQNIGMVTDDVAVDELNAKIMDLTIDNNELRRKLSKVSVPSLSMEAMEKLKSENEFLKARVAELTQKEHKEELVDSKDDEKKSVPSSGGLDLPELDEVKEINVSDNSLPDITKQKDSFANLLDELNEEG